MSKKSTEIQAALDRVDFGIAAEHQRISDTRERIKVVQEERDELVAELFAASDPRDVYRNLSPSDPLFAVKNEANKDWKKRLRLVKKDIEQNPKKHAEFMADMARQHQENVIEGFLDGWWDLDENGNMAAPALKFSLADFADVKNPLMAHVMKEAGIFPSVGQARKNNWDKPLTEGQWTVTKKKIIIKVTK